MLTELKKISLEGSARKLKTQYFLPPPYISLISFSDYRRQKKALFGQVLCSYLPAGFFPCPKSQDIPSFPSSRGMQVGDAGGGPENQKISPIRSCDPPRDAFLGGSLHLILKSWSSSRSIQAQAKLIATIQRKM